MIPYPHFAFPNIFLENGYSNIETEYGPARQYENEEALEQAIRHLVLRKASALNGRDLKFLRRGLCLSQGEFGKFLGRDGQTVARWEKSNKPLPRYADIAIRVRFAERFDSGMTIDELCSLIEGKAEAHPAKIIFRLRSGEWVTAIKDSLLCVWKTTWSKKSNNTVLIFGGSGAVGTRLEDEVQYTPPSTYLPLEYH